MPTLLFPDSRRVLFALPCNSCCWTELTSPLHRSLTRSTRGSLKEVIQPHLPVRLPCYDFTPLAGHTLGTAIPVRVRQVTSGAPDSSGVTGGVYKAREHIHRSMLTCGY